MKFSDLVVAEDAPSADVRAAIARAEAAQAAANEQVETLTQRRAAALVEDASEKALDAIEGEIAKAARARDRAQLAGEELRRRLVEAEERERLAEIEATYQRGQKAQARGVQLITKRYRKLATELAKVLDELSDCEQAIHEANELLHKAGDGRRLEEADFLARPRLYRPQLVAPRLSAAVVLPDPVHPEITCYPPMEPPSYGPIHALVRPAKAWNDRPEDLEPAAPPAQVGWLRELKP